MTTMWLYWTYVGIMAAGTLGFLGWHRNPKGIPRRTYGLPVAILVWSGCWHAAIALGWGEAAAPDRPVHWARFVDWLVTVPLLVIALALTATYALREKRPGLTALLAMVNFLMILLGLGAEAAAGATARFALYGAGMIVLALAVVLIRGPLWATAHHQPAEMAAHFCTSALLLCVVWVSFPAVWILGPPGFGLLGETGSTALFLVLSVLMKLGWSVFDVGRLRRLSDRGEFVLVRAARNHPTGQSRRTGR